jgi:hypothetical protein
MSFLASQIRPKVAFKIIIHSYSLNSIVIWLQSEQESPKTRSKLKWTFSILWKFDN